MGVLRSVVSPAPRGTPVRVPARLQGRAVGPELVGDDLLGPPVPLHQLLEELERRSPAPGLSAEAFTPPSPRPCRFISFLRNLSAAALSRVFETNASSTSPSWSMARQR